MQAADSSDIDESNKQLHTVWKMFAKSAPAGDVSEAGGILATFSNVSLFLFNMTFLSSPVSDLSGLRNRVSAAHAYAARARVPWVFTICDEWIAGSLREQVPSVCAAAGLVPMMKMRGMAAQELRTPGRPLPELRYERASEDQGGREVADINSAAYGMPPSIGREALCHGKFWGENLFGYTGYVDGKAVTTSTTILADGRLYVALVATLPEYRGRGFGEAVMRHSLREAGKATGFRRTVLHSSDAGFNLYQQMGYRLIADFTCYGAAE